MNDEIKNYIDAQRKLGNTDEQIRVALKTAGWEDSDVETALEQLNSVDAPDVGAVANNPSVEQSESRKPQTSEPSANKRVIQVMNNNFLVPVSIAFITWVAGFVIFKYDIDLIEYRFLAESGGYLMYFLSLGFLLLAGLNYFIKWKLIPSLHYFTYGLCGVFVLVLFSDLYPYVVWALALINIVISIPLIVYDIYKREWKRAFLLFGLICLVILLSFGLLLLSAGAGV